ncbi:hypothetical protein [Aliarcobacter butzleri]|uniref:hypothetical protein n=1 Tax=Aliarcobacter butzleri TaxID=28197 RepID=UPI003AFA2E38
MKLGGVIRFESCEFIRRWKRFGVLLKLFRKFVSYKNSLDYMGIVKYWFLVYGNK